MEFSIQKLPKSQIEIFFEISTDEFKDYFEKAIENLGKEIELEGFRKGKVPKEILESKINQSEILEEATDLAIKENYVRAILENKIEVISSPEIEIIKIAKGSPLEFKAKVSVLPEINLPDYKKIASDIERKEVFVEEKEIEESINWLQKSRAKFIFKKEPAKFGDFVEIEFQSPQIEGGLKRKDSFILGQGHFIPGFEKNLEGMTEGLEKEFSLKFPDNYFQKELTGKEVIFKVKMNSVQKIELPEITDSWAKNLGNFKNLAAFKKSVEEEIKTEKEIEESLRIRQEILKKITENSSFETPETLIESEKNRIFNNFKNKISETFKTPFEDYLNKIKKSEKEVRDSFSEEAQIIVKNLLILREIAKLEKIEVSQEEINKETDEILKNLAVEKAKELDLEKLKMYIKDEIRKEKTLKYLESLAR